MVSRDRNCGLLKMNIWWCWFWRLGIFMKPQEGENNLPVWPRYSCYASFGLRFSAISSPIGVHGGVSGRCGYVTGNRGNSSSAIR